MSVFSPGNEPANAAWQCDIFHGWTWGEHAWPSVSFQVTHVTCVLIHIRGITSFD